MKNLGLERYCYCCRWELVQNLHQWNVTDKWLHSFLFSSKLNRVGFIICVNKRGASLLIHPQIVPPSAVTRHPADYTWQSLLLIVWNDKLLPHLSQSLIPHPRMAQITVGQIWDQGGDLSQLPLFVPGTHFSAPGLVSGWHLLVVNLIYPQSCFLIVTNVTFWAVRITIKADISSITTHKLKQQGLCQQYMW